MASRVMAATAVTTAPDGNRRMIGLKIAVLARQMRQCFDEQVERMSVTRAQWALIAAVARNPGATQRLIATQLEVTDVTAGRMIDRICADGLLERREHPTDRRAYCVHLTPAAQPLLKTLMEVAAEYEQAIFASLDDADLDRLVEMLDTLSRNVATLRRSGGARLRPAMRRTAAERSRADMRHHYAGGLAARRGGALTRKRSFPPPARAPSGPAPPPRTGGVPARGTMIDALGQAIGMTAPPSVPRVRSDVADLFRNVGRPPSAS